MDMRGFRQQRYRFRDIATMSGGTLVGSGDGIVSDVQIDSRLCRDGSVFVALQGSNADGHRFVGDAVFRGCRLAIVNRKNLGTLEEGSCTFIAVSDPLEALSRLAASHIARFPEMTVVGVTGSCGKSTTKEAIAAIASVLGPTVKTPGNLNSEIGLPLSLLQVSSDTRYGIFEMGIDHVGEMDRMVGVCRPDYAVLTNIGISHLEKFGSRDVIAREKGRIFHSGLQGGFIAESCSYVDSIERRQHVRLTSYGLSDVTFRNLGLDGWAIGYGGKTFHLGCVGSHMLLDVVGAIKVARSLGASASDIAEGLDGFVPMQGRSSILAGEVTIIEDYYNASPDSTRSILRYMEGLCWKNGGKKAVLGPMLELGRQSEPAHRLVAGEVVRAGLKSAFLYGKEMRGAYDELRRLGYEGKLRYTDDFTELEDQVRDDTNRGDLYLVKGSRGAAMERIVPTIRMAG